MKNNRLLRVLGIWTVCLLVACGGSEKPKPQTQETQEPVTAPQVSVQTPEKTPEESAAENAAVEKAAEERAKQPGPIAVIKDKGARLLANPKSSAPSLTTLKPFENVYILQFVMTDDEGKETSYPTCYQVETKNKKRGWVDAKTIDAGGGG